MSRSPVSSEPSAFVVPHLSCCSLSSIPGSALTCRRRLASTSTPRCVARRQRLRGTATPSKPEDSGEEKPKQEQPQPAQPDEEAAPMETLSAADVEASDLSLPSLRDLFAGAGRPDCEQCKGKGEVPCPVCFAKGFISLTMMDTTSSVQCRMCKGHRAIPCPSCRDMVYKSVVWWDQIPPKEEDPNEDWREGPDGPKISWSDPPAGP